jgi:uncharacterized protein (DUF2141 family)
VTGQALAAAGIGLALVFAGGIGAQQPRDNRMPPAAGRGAIFGTIVDGEQGQPLRRAVVRMTGSDLEAARIAVTGEDGSFTFGGLPPGRYSLSAAKDGHVGMNYGASGPGRPGRTIPIGSGETRRVILPLPRGSVVTGSVAAPGGDPAPGVPVAVLSSTFEANSGERRFSIVRGHEATTDDRGTYRIFGLPAGGYLVAALPRLQGGQAGLHVLTSAEIRAALADVAAARTARRPGMPEPLAPREAVEDRPAGVSLAPVFYPGSTLQERATPITLGPGEVRAGVNIDLEYVPLSTVSGSVTTPPGARVIVQIASADRAAANPSVRALSSPRENGQFTFPRVPPGAYAITARAFPSTARTGANPAEALMWGETQLAVGGDDIDGIAITLREPLSIAGELVFDSETAAPPELQVLRVPLNAVSVSSSHVPAFPSVLVEGHRFRIAGVVPGTYRLTTPPRGVRAPIGRWWLKSMSLDGREALDSELEIRESTDRASITFSDRASELSGVVREADGSPVADGFVVIFSTDRRHWFHQSRRIGGLRLTEGGRYVIRNLPPGEYYVAVSDDLLLNEWFDPQVLERLAQGATTIRLSLDEIRVFDLRRSR